MKRNKIWLINTRVFNTTIFLLSVCILMYNDLLKLSPYLIALDVVVIIYFLIFTWIAWLLRYKVYEYKGINIVIYAGYTSYILYVNGKAVDTLKNAKFRNKVELHYTNFDDELPIEAIDAELVLFNRITLKVDDIEVKPIKSL